MELLDIRKAAQKNGEDFVNNLNHNLRFLANDIIDKNIYWAFINQGTNGYHWIIEYGFTQNQQLWLKKLSEQLSQKENGEEKWKK